MFIIRWLTVFFLFLPLQVWAASFKVIPAKLFLNTEKQTGIFKIINTDTEKIAFQLNPMQWRQDAEGNDQYEATKDIVFFPKILTVRSGEERIVRLGYQGTGVTSNERAYRLFVRELPVPKPGEKKALRMTMNIGLPVFVTPAEKREKKSVETIRISNGKVLVRIKNSGNVHLMPQQIHLTGFDASDRQIFTKSLNGWYVLPGISKTFLAEIPFQVCDRTKTVKIAVEP